MKRTCCGALLLLATATLHADAPGVYAITGGTVHTVSGAEIANGTVIVRDGLIEAAGSGIAIPADAAVIDASGQHVYPGLIDAQTSIGFAAPRPRRSPFGGGGPPVPPRAEQPPLPETSPAFEAVRNVNLSDDDLDAKRASGVTTIVTAPAFGIFNGQSVILNLSEGRPESRVIRTPAAMQVSFNTRPTWTYPDSLMGVIAYIRQGFLDAQEQVAARAVYERNPAGNRRPDDSPAIDALAPVLRRDVPVVFVADSELMIRRAQAIAREMNLRMIVAGARQAYRMAPELKGTPVLVSVKWPAPPADKDEREDQPLRVIRERQLAPTTPAALAKNGVTFALASGAGKAGDFLPGIRKAIESGLPADDALRATTLWPARIFGIDRQLGSIERGKIANLVVTDKPIFAKGAKVKRVLVDGREIRLPAEEKKETAEAASPIDGGWDLAVRSAGGDVTIHVTLHAEDQALGGTFSGDRGSGDIRGGSFDGTNVAFTINVKTDAESSDWVFRGTLADGSLSGTVSTNLGTFQFTGRRSR
ncbi:MAG: amidohydrolase family protein [Thermoanaerobaculia bacterium]